MRYRNLDVMRFFCALTVLFFHYTDIFHPGPLMCHGYLAVDVFFIISGFVISLNYEHRLRAGLSTSGFLFARGRRLLPIFWIGTAVCGMAALIVSQNTCITVAEIIANLILLPLFIPGASAAFPVNNASWSLFAEWVINALYSTLFRKFRTVAIILIVTIGWGAMAYLGFYTRQGWCIGGDLSGLFTYGLLRAISGFLAGVLIYRLRDKIIPYIPAIEPRLLFCIWLLLATIPTFRPMPIFDAITVIFFAPLLLLLLIRSESRAPKWSECVGRLSYPIYASHVSIITLIHYFNHRPAPLFGVFGIVATFALAWIIAALNDRIQAWLPRPKAIPASAHPAE